MCFLEDLLLLRNGSFSLGLAIIENSERAVVMVRLHKLVVELDCASVIWFKFYTAGCRAHLIVFYSSCLDTFQNRSRCCLLPSV